MCNPDEFAMGFAETIFDGDNNSSTAGKDGNERNRFVGRAS